MTATATKTRPTPKTEDTVHQVPVSQIDPGNNDRKQFDPVSLQELADSIRSHGLAQPITIRPVEGDRYQIVAGERRYRAILLNGSTVIPALIRNLSDEESAAIMLAENVHRVDLNPMDEEQAYRTRMDQFGWTVAQVATAANMTPHRVQSRIGLLDFSWEVQSLVRSGNLTLGYADLMGGLDNNNQIIALRYFSSKKRPTLDEFRVLCSQLLQKQAQNAMFDLDAFSVQQESIQARTGPRPFPYAYNEQLPPLKPARSIDLALEQYMGTLLAAGHQDAALILGTIYKGLQDANLVRGPRSIERLTRG